MDQNKIKNLLIAPGEIGGIGLTLNKNFKKRGIKSVLLTYEKHAFNYLSDECLNLQDRPKIVQVFIVMTNFIKSLFLYDSFLFIFNSLLPWNLDLPILKLFGKKIGVIFCGCDIRYPCHLNKECTLKINIIKKKWRAKIFQRYADFIFSQPEYSQLLSRKYEYFFSPVDLDEWTANFISNKVPVIVHAPSDREVKGTKYVLEVIEKLKKNGYKFKFILLEKIPYREMKNSLKNCDIVIDQLLLGWHGLLATEAMALGKPVLGYIREDLKKYSPELPIVSVSKSSLYENLKSLILNPKLCLELGKKGRDYAEKYHNSSKIASKIINLYYIGK